MLFNSAPVRNEFVEPPPQDQSSATLVLGDQRLACRLIELSIGGFTVMVPNAATWTGEPVGRLVTHDSVFKVRIIKQAARYDGFEATLLRVDDSTNDNRKRPPRWIGAGSRLCAVSLAVVIGCCVIATRGGITDNPNPATGLRDLVSSWFASPPAIPPSADKPDDTVEMPMITVSLDDDDDGDSPRSIIASTVSKETTPVPVVDVHALLREAVTAADSRRSRPVNSTTLPWLFLPGESTANGGLRCRMLTSAEEDLRLFEAGLKQLPKQSADSAVLVLRRSLAAIATSPASAVAGFSQVRLIHSEDADIYFRVVDGEPELLRILPVELENSSPTRTPSAAATRRSMHR